MPISSYILNLKLAKLLNLQLGPQPNRTQLPPSASFYLVNLAARQSIKLPLHLLQQQISRTPPRHPHSASSGSAASNLKVLANFLFLPQTHATTQTDNEIAANVGSHASSGSRKYALYVQLNSQRDSQSVSQAFCLCFRRCGKCVMHK